MSDPKSSYGEPVDEPKDADRDVVGRAHEGLADAEAARSVSDGAGADPAASPGPAAASDAPAFLAPGQDESATDASSPVPEAAATGLEPAAPPASSWYERQDDDEARWAAYAASADASEPAAAPAAGTTSPAVAVTPAVTASEPVVETTALAGGAGAIGQPIFVQAPEAPAPRGNRGAAGAIGLLAALAFAVLYLSATLAVGLLHGDFGVDGVVSATVRALTTAALWVPVVVFFIAFWFLGALINRGRWGHWVVWGLLVGVAAWAGHLLGALFQAPFWQLTARQGVDLLEAQVLSPLAIVAFVLGRELTIWFGAWVAARGRRVTEINLEAQREYERTLEAGPQLHRV